MNRTSDHETGRRPATRAAPPAAPLTVPAQRGAPDRESRTRRAPGGGSAPVSTGDRSHEGRTHEAAAGELHGCRCGHPAASHDHFRPGTDCAACDCRRYVTTTGLARQIAAILRRGK